MRVNSLIRLFFWSVVTASAVADTTVSPQDARLLTPLGAERAGNTAGTIPAWEGGITKPPHGYVPGEHHVDPFPDDQPRLTITADSLDLHADRLSPGQQALLRANPDSWYLQVYPTRRTASYPEWVYDTVRDNARTARLLTAG